MRNKLFNIFIYFLLVVLSIALVYFCFFYENEKQNYKVGVKDLSDTPLVSNILKQEQKDEVVKLDDEKEEIIEEVPEIKQSKIRTYNIGAVEYNKRIAIKSIIKVPAKGHIDTTKLGSFTRKVKVDKITYTIKYKVVDTTPPVILGGNKTITKGSTTKIKDLFLCGDNYDDVPKCKVIGDYDVNKVGKYKLRYKATDSSGNKTVISFTLTVKEKSTSTSTSTSTKTKKPISKYIKKYKNEETMIGIDVSSWQDEINWEKAKKAGVEFAIIRIGFGHTNSGEIKMDKQFKNNIKNAKKAGVKVGLYFFSYAENEEQAKEHAEWIVNQLDGEELDLPIAFDWENWGSFNSYKMSFTRVHNTAQTFIDTVEEYGYTGMLYSSAYYLTRLWGRNFKNQWLAYYTDNNDYTEKPFMLWQATSSGKVSGVPGYVDIDILYKNKIK